MREDYIQWLEHMLVFAIGKFLELESGKVPTLEDKLKGVVRFEEEKRTGINKLDEAIRELENSPNLS